jgi:flavin-binding protein dodecin
VQRCNARTCDAPSVCDTYRKENNATAKVVKVIELMSQSPESWEDAAQGTVKEATKTLRNIRSIYVKEFTAEVDGGKISNYRINAKVTFDLETER